MARRPGGLIEELTGSVIGAFFDVHNTLGHGFLEHVCAVALERELLGRGHRVGREVSVDIACKGITLTSQRLDFVVDEKLMVEARSTQNLPAFAARQLYNYLRATNLAIGLLLHFGPEPKFHRLISPRALRLQWMSRLIRPIRRIRFPELDEPRFASTGRDTYKAVNRVRHEHQFCIVPLAARRSGATGTRAFAPLWPVARGPWPRAHGRVA